jgi:hypothetical protein
MWLNTGHIHEDIPAGLDTVQNYYERLVLDEISHSSDRAREDLDFFADVASVALNRLPPRYIRDDVDMTFFLSPVELQEIHDKVELAVSSAIDYVVSSEPPLSEQDSGLEPNS